MNRRNFFKGVMPLLSIPLISNKMFANVLDRNEISEAALGLLQGDIDRVLVLIKLHGGNDGINTVIPLDQYAKLIDPRVRKDIIVPERNILKLNSADKIGFHPSLTAMRTLFNDQKLSVIQGVANSAGVFSHFHGIEQWETASDKNNTYDSGWIGRYIEKTYSQASTAYPNNCMPDPLAIEIGPQPTRVTRGTTEIFSQTLSTEFNGNLSTLIENYHVDGISQNMKRELEFLRGEQGHTVEYGNRIVSAWSKGANSSVVYPQSVVPGTFHNGRTSISQQLKIVARLINGGLKSRIFVVSMGNFDTHKEQIEGNNPASGWHSYLLKDLSDAIGAFMNDTNQLGIADRIVGMTYSEFGRRIAQNGANGTEHGLGAPMFVFGNKVKGGLIGENVNIDLATINKSTNVPLQYDYRQVYMSVLTNWFGTCKADAIEILKKDVNPVSDIFKSDVVMSPCLAGPIVDPKSPTCGTIVNVVEIDGDHHDLYARISPNPNSGSFKLSLSFGFDLNVPTHIKIIDLNGKVLFRKEYQNTDNEIDINVNLTNQIYVLNLQNGLKMINCKFVVTN